MLSELTAAQIIEWEAWYRLNNLLLSPEDRAELRMAGLRQQLNTIVGGDKKMPMHKFMVRFANQIEDDEQHEAAADIRSQWDEAAGVETS